MSDKVLVCGATGFLGSHITKRLLADSYQVRATFHRTSPKDLLPGIAYRRADLINAADCSRMADKINAVFMCAAVTSGAAVIVDNPLAHVIDNVVMNARILNAAYNAGVKQFVFISSSTVYPDTGGRPTREGKAFRQHPHPKYWWVGHMKRYAERLCQGYALHLSRPMNATIIRPSNVYGPSDKFDPATSHMVAALIRKVVERQDPIEVWGTGGDIRDHIYVDDFVDGVMLAFNKGERCLAVNIATGTGHSVKQVLETLLRVDGYENANVVYQPDKPTTIPIRLVDVSLAKRLLGFEAKVSLEEGLRRTVEWYRQCES